MLIFQKDLLLQNGLKFHLNLRQECILSSWPLLEVRMAAEPWVSHIQLHDLAVRSLWETC